MGEEAARKEPGRAFGGVPRPEVLDDRLRVDPGLWILRELPHRRRAPEPTCSGAELFEDLLVGVSTTQAGAEGGELRLVDAQLRTPAGARTGHTCKQLRAF